MRKEIVPFELRYGSEYLHTGKKLMNWICRQNSPVDSRVAQSHSNSFFMNYIYQEKFCPRKLVFKGQSCYIGKQFSILKFSRSFQFSTQCTSFLESTQTGHPCMLKVKMTSRTAVWCTTQYALAKRLYRTCAYLR